MADVYETLFVEDEASLDAEVANALKGVVRLMPGRDCIVPDGEFGKLSTTQRLVVYALARFALSRAEQGRGISAEATSNEFSKGAGVALKVCRDLLCRLKRRHVLEREGEGYIILPVNVRKAIDAIRRPQAE